MICITFDTDWMEPAWLDRFLEKWTPPGQATIFQHRSYPALATQAHELCPHPIIHSLEEWKKGVERFRDEVAPGSQGVRPHSCVFSHALGVGLRELGFRWISQANNQYETDLEPVRHPWGLWELPIYYMDNMDFWMARNWPSSGHQAFSPAVIANALMNEDKLFVFAFHPLHMALNTSGPDGYAAVKSRILDRQASPFDLRGPGRGTATFYEELCDAMLKKNARSWSCSDALAQFGAAGG